MKYLISAIFVLGVYAMPAQAVVLSPGLNNLPGTTVAADPFLAGTVVQDVVTPFSFSAYGGTVSGEVQNRVVLSVDGTYDFY